MRKIKSALTIFIVSAMLTASCCFAGTASGGVSKKSYYDEGMAEFELENYSDAADLFEQAGSYKDSAQYALYCRGMEALEKADELEDSDEPVDALDQLGIARDAFSDLAMIPFLESETLKDYCSARYYQLTGSYKSAEEIYAALHGFRDSISRKKEAGNRLPYPFVTPRPTISPAMRGIKAKAIKNVTYIYLGPNDGYVRDRTVKVNLNDEVTVFGRVGTYYLAGKDINGEEVRFWLYSVGTLELSSGNVPELKLKGKDVLLWHDADSFYGPGEENRKHEDKIPAFSNVTAYDTEGAYTMVEYTPAGSDMPVIAWILSSSLNK